MPMEFCSCYAAEIKCLTVQPLHSLHGHTAYELVTGNTPDVSEYLEFEWYQLIWYYETHAFPEDKRLIGHWIGVAHQLGQAMCYWILPASRVPITRTTIQALTDDEVATVEVQQTVKAYNESIQAKIGDSVCENDLPEPSQYKMHSQDE